jgi:hypothetical protein
MNILVLFLIIVNPIYGQEKNNKTPEKEIAELKAKFTTTKSDSIKIDILNNIGTLYYSIKKDDSSFLNFTNAFHLANKIDNYKLKITSAHNLMSINSNLGNFFEAVNIGLEMIKECEKKEDVDYILYFLISIHDTYRLAKDPKNQIEYSLKAIELAKKHESNYAKSILYDYATLGDDYQSVGKLDSALHYFNLDYQLALKDSTHGFNITYSNLGEINLRLKNYDIALNYFKKAMSYFDVEYANGQTNEISFPELLLETSKVFNEMGRKDSAIRYARLCYSYANKMNSNEYLKSSSENLYTLFEEKKQYDSAFFYQNIYIKLKDKLYNEEKTRKLEYVSIQQKIDEEKRLEEIELQEENRKKNLTLAAIGIFIPFFISMLFVISKWGKRKSKWLTSMGIASLLMLFEFISLLIHPYIEKITHENIGLMYVILLLIASTLVPLHHKMESFIKNKFSHTSSNSEH